MPIEIAEFFGSMISMDAPKHTRLRMIVQKAFTPKVVAAIEEDVRRKAKAIVDEHAEKGEGDFVQLFAVSAAAADHLRDDGHRARPVEHGVRGDEHHPRHRRPRVRAPTWVS